MKKIITLIIALIVIQPAVFASDDRSITVEQLPAKAQKFIKTHFAASQVSYVTVDEELFDKNYDVVFSDGSRLEFDKKGQWTDVECKQSMVPKSVIPIEIAKIVATKHSGTEICKIERNTKNYEVKLNNGIEMYFDLRYRFLGYDD